MSTASMARLPTVSRRKAMAALAESGAEVKAIAVALGASVWTVRRWILRSETTERGFEDLPRAGRRRVIYDEAAKLRIVAFYCQTKPLSDCGRWSLRWAARHLEDDPARVGVSPSKSTLHRILQENRLKPHQSRYFLHITDPAAVHEHQLPPWMPTLVLTTQSERFQVFDICRVWIWHDECLLHSSLLVDAESERMKPQNDIETVYEERRDPELGDLKGVNDCIEFDDLDLEFFDSYDPVAEPPDDFSDLIDK